jgi:DNA-binding MarR family transcriptional regulator
MTAKHRGAGIKPPVPPRTVVEHGYDEFPPEERLAWSYFLKSYRAVVEAVDKELREVATITLAEYELLLHVTRAGGRIRFIELARVSLLSQSRVSRQIDALQAKGYLNREITTSDRRATFAVLTSAGAKAFDQAAEPFARAFHANFLDLIPKGKLGVFTEILRKLLRDANYSAACTEILTRARAQNAEPSDKAEAASLP